MAWRSAGDIAFLPVMLHQFFSVFPCRLGLLGEYYVNGLVPLQGESMKGKRKVKTAKWLLAEQCRVEACVLLSGRSSKASRFLDVVLSIGPDAEPCGSLAGSLRH